MSNTEIARAKEARRLHINHGHPSDRVLINALNERAYRGIDLVGRDVLNSNRLLGKCQACQEAKMQVDHGIASMNIKSEFIGETLYGDLIPLNTRCIGGYYHGILLVDAKTGFVTINGLRSKASATVKEVLYETIEIEFTAYRKTNKLWENPIEEVKYEIIGQDIFRMELGEPVAFYGK